MFVAFKELLNGDDIVTEDLEDGCRRIVVLLGCFGLLTKPVRSDLTEKLDSIQLLRTECEGPHYRTVRCLVQFEKQNRIHKSHPKHGYRTGCYALNRLVWAMDFMAHLFRRMSVLEPDDDSLYGPATGAYEETLGKHHNWLVRSGAYLILNFLPSKSTLLNSLRGSDEEILEQCRWGSEVCGEVHSFLVGIFQEFHIDP
jgi:hypothetical protein